MLGPVTLQPRLACPAPTAAGLCLHDYMDASAVRSNDLHMKEALCMQQGAAGVMQSYCRGGAGSEGSASIQDLSIKIKADSGCNKGSVTGGTAHQRRIRPAFEN